MASPAARRAASSLLRSAGDHAAQKRRARPAGDRWEAALRAARRRGGYGYREPLAAGVRRAPAAEGAKERAERGVWWLPPTNGAADGAHPEAAGAGLQGAALSGSATQLVPSPTAAGKSSVAEAADDEARRALLSSVMGLDSAQKAELGVLARCARRFPRGAVEPERGAPPGVALRRMSRRLERLVEGERVPALSAKRGELFTFAMQAAVEDGRLPSPLHGKKARTLPERDWMGLPRGLRASRRVTPEQAPWEAAAEAQRETALAAVDGGNHAAAWRGAEPGLVRYFDAHAQRISAHAKSNRRAMARQLWRGITDADRRKATDEGLTAIESHEVAEQRAWAAEEVFPGLGVKLGEADAAGDGQMARATRRILHAADGEAQKMGTIVLRGAREMDAAAGPPVGAPRGSAQENATSHRVGSREENFERLLYRLQDFAAERRFLRAEAAEAEAQQRVEAEARADDEEASAAARRRRIAEVKSSGTARVDGNTAAARLAELSRLAAARRKEREGGTMKK